MVVARNAYDIHILKLKLRVQDLQEVRRDMAHGIGKLTGRSQPWKERKKERSVFNEGVII